MKINEDYSAVSMFGEHLCRILDPKMEKQMNWGAEDCHVSNKYVLIFRTVIRHSQLYRLFCNCKTFVALQKKILHFS